MKHYGDESLASPRFFNASLLLLRASAKPSPINTITLVTNHWVYTLVIEITMAGVWKKEYERLKKYQGLKKELEKMWKVPK